MILLAWDTETTGFVNDREKPDHPSQPHLVQLGLVLYDSTGAERTYASVIVKPDGWVIPARAAAVHGITTEIANEVGVPLVVPLALFAQLARAATEHAAPGGDGGVRIDPRSIEPDERVLLTFTYARRPWVLTHRTRGGRTSKGCHPINHVPTSAAQWLRALKCGAALLNSMGGHA